MAPKREKREKPLHNPLLEQKKREEWRPPPKQIIAKKERVTAEDIEYSDDSETDKEHFGDTAREKLQFKQAGKEAWFLRIPPAVLSELVGKDVEATVDTLANGTKEVKFSLDSVEMKAALAPIKEQGALAEGPDGQQGEAEYVTMTYSHPDQTDWRVTRGVTHMGTMVVKDAKDAWNMTSKRIRRDPAPPLAPIEPASENRRLGVVPPPAKRQRRESPGRQGEVEGQVRRFIQSREGGFTLQKVIDEVGQDHVKQAREALNKLATFDKVTRTYIPK